MWKNIIVLVALLDIAFSASIHHCPDGSSCQQQTEDHLETTSFDFLSKFNDKQLRALVKLTISNATIHKVDPRLKYLKNLSYLNLSHNNVLISSIPSLNNLKTLILKANNLKSINLTALPQNIEVLDISNNFLSHIPENWRSLKYLKTLHLYKNPIDCNCNNIWTYGRIIKSEISVPGSIICASPKKQMGKDISTIYCPIDELMLYDEPYDGSGETDIFDDNSNLENVPFVEEKDEEDADTLDKNTIIDDKEEALLDTTSDFLGSNFQEEEGSGDEGSGYGILPETGVLGCIENCTTPGPVGSSDEEFASPIPSVIDQAMILFDDVNLFNEHPTTTSVETSSATTTKAPVKEPKILKETEKPLLRQSDKSEDAEVIGNATNTGELERASAVPQDSTAVYAIVGVGLFLAVLFLVAFLKKRKSKRRQDKHDIPNSFGEEMRPLSKPITSPNEKPTRISSHIPEQIPLINGQNGKTKDNTPKLTSFTPLAHPELPKEDHEEDMLEQNGHSVEPDGVEFRSKLQPELLTPQRERVTIRESEIPDSIPKTPLFIHRQKNSDGEIVTTTVP